MPTSLTTKLCQQISNTKRGLHFSDLPGAKKWKSSPTPWSWRFVNQNLIMSRIKMDFLFRDAWQTAVDILNSYLYHVTSCHWQLTISDFEWANERGKNRVSYNKMHIKTSPLALLHLNFNVNKLENIFFWFFWVSSTQLDDNIETPF